MYKFMGGMWKKPQANLGDSYRKNIVRWRTEPTIVRIERPTRLDRARGLGYKAKTGIMAVRVRVDRGSRKIPKFAGGRRPARSGRFFTLNKSGQQVAEEKAGSRYPNMRVLNSYWAGEDGKYRWYEIILADPSHPAVRKDSNLKWVKSGKHSGRAFRGLTSSGRRSRGLKHRGKKGL